jgi:triosephosphate isomerase
LHYQPIIDFTDYKEGTDWKAAVSGKVSANAPEGLSTIWFSNIKTGEDQTEKMLSDGLTYLLVLPDISTADPGNADVFNDLYDWSEKLKYRFVCVVGDGASEDDVEGWVDQTGAIYPILISDEVALKGMARSNPSLLMLKDGVLLKKWNNNNLPEFNETNILDFKSFVSEAPISSFGDIVFLFFVPLFGVSLIDRIWVGSKYYKNYIR